MAAFALAVPLSSTSSVPILCSSKGARNSSKNKQTVSVSGGGALGNVMEVVKKDMEFIKKGFGESVELANKEFEKGIGWANKTLRIPQVVKKVDDFIWLRNLENPEAVLPSETPSWPQLYYPELSGVDLFIADLNALEAYFKYFYYLSLMWTKPLPEMYDPQEVADYFNLRPHVVALRLFEVFLAFASAAIKIRISGISSAVGKKVDKNVLQYNFGMLLKETMLNLGPTFMKIGQSLSTRPDIIGSEISKALSGLHDQIPPFPRTIALKIIEEELGSPVEKAFSYISGEPVAGASFGQVYRGTTLDGCDVAVKVQRPNLRHLVVRDIYILRLGLALLQKIAKRKSDLRLYADELGKGLVGELDYTLEAANAEEFMEAHSPYPFIRVPKVLRHLSQKRVLTMEWMVGESPRDLLSASTETVDRPSGFGGRQQEAKRKLLDMVNKGVEASLIQLLETGLLHADPHPGNLRYISSRQIGFLDFGLLCRMEKKHQFAMLSSIMHIVYGDWASLVNALTEMDVVQPGTNLRRVTMDLEDALEEVEFQNGIPNVKFSLVLGKIWSVALKYHFRMPPYYTLVLRSLASLEGLAVAADPNFKTFEAAYPYVVRKLLTDNSAYARRILYSVVLNRRKEFQWQKLALFLRVGAARRGLNLVAASSSQTSPKPSSNGDAGLYDVANLILRILLSKDGTVLRRLLMTADGSSLIRAMVSKEARSFRKQLCTVIGDVLYLWMLRTLGKGVLVCQLSSQVMLAGGANSIGVDSSSSLQMINDYESFLRDRRIKVIIFNILDSARKDRALMLRFYWTSFVMLITASVVACTRVFVTLFEASIARASFAPKQIVVGV